MTTEYIYEGEKFTVSKPEDCTMKVSKDGCTAVISVAEQSGKYRVSADDGIIASTADNEESALRKACSRILGKLRGSTKEELCSQLDDLYDKIRKGDA